MSEIYFKRLNVAFIVSLALLCTAEILYSCCILYTYLLTIDFKILIHSLSFIPAVVLLLLSVLTLILIIFGCFGILSEVICCVECYGTIMLMIALFQVGCGVASLYVYNMTNRYVNDDITKNVEGAFLFSSSHMSTIETMFHCCGSSGPQRYPNVNLPLSCCDITRVETITNCTIASNSYRKGCNLAQFEYVIGSNTILSYINIAHGSLEIIVGIATCVLSCCYLRKYRSYDP
ncbi:23 kDa integral membrane protein-like [Aethina tumida]|uniref:23 kDa integral membrane protein-like n=1 Tax=Aethina tumida TaxID=116153 RepID=UPI002147A198|nr:23 kDa integral membrane protein-like [Aethina tumida]